MRRVLEGGAGEDSGGNVERSSDKGDRDRFLESEDGDAPGERGGEFGFEVSRGESCGRSVESAIVNCPWLMVVGMAEWW